MIRNSPYLKEYCPRCRSENREREVSSERFYGATPLQTCGCGRTYIHFFAEFRWPAPWPTELPTPLLLFCPAATGRIPEWGVPRGGMYEYSYTRVYASHHADSPRQSGEGGGRGEIDEGRVDGILCGIACTLGINWKMWHRIGFGRHTSLGRWECAIT